jgi:hypothetical protein
LLVHPTRIVASASAFAHRCHSLALRGKMIGSPRHLYVLDIYWNDDGSIRSTVDDPQRQAQSENITAT